jgi:hypothetical protein
VTMRTKVLVAAAKLNGRLRRWIIGRGWDDYHRAQAAKTAVRAAALQVAVDRAYAALTESQYVGGPSEREAWRIATTELGAVVTEYRSAPEVPES